MVSLRIDFRIVVLCLGSMFLLGSVFGSTSARALTLSPDPFAVDFMGIEGEVTLLSVEMGVPTGGTVTIGVASPTDVTLVLRASLDPGSLPGLSLFLSLRDSSGTVPFSAVGVIDGPDTDILITGASLGVANFAPVELIGGTVLDAVFLSFAAPLATDGSLSLHASFISSGQSDGSAQVVPEPATGVLVMIGLLAFGARRAARS